jgi:hypothetical protein
MEELDTYRQRLLSALEGVIPALSKTMGVMPPNGWQHPYKQGAHTSHYTLAHLCALEAQAFNPVLHRIVEEDDSLLPLFDDPSWMANQYKPDKPAQLIFEEFAILRKQEVIWLSSLPSGCWCNTARHPWWGLHTLQWWVELQLDYSHQHVADLVAPVTN